MNSEIILFEIIVSITYNKPHKYFKDYIFSLIEEVELVKSYCTGNYGSYVLSSGNKSINENELIEIIMKHIYLNINKIEKFKMKIWRYNKKGKLIKNKKYKPF